MRRVFVKKCVSEDAIVVLVSETQLVQFIAKCETQFGLDHESTSRLYVLLNLAGSSKALVQRLGDIRDGDVLLLQSLATKSIDSKDVGQSIDSKDVRQMVGAIDSDDARQMAESINAKQIAESVESKDAKRQSPTDPLVSDEYEDNFQLSVAGDDTSRVSDLSSKAETSPQTVDSDTEAEDEPVKQESIVSDSIAAKTLAKKRKHVTFFDDDDDVVLVNIKPVAMETRFARSKKDENDLRKARQVSVFVDQGHD